MSIRSVLGRAALVLVVPVGVMGTAAVPGAVAPSASGWTLVASPDHRSNSVGFAGVSCASTAFCMAVGAVAGSRATAPFTSRWDGTAWIAVATPRGAPPGASLHSVACVSASWCVAVGASAKSLVEQWDGTSWKVVRSASPRAGGDVLSSVTCRSRTWCRAVGQSFNPGGQDRTLIEGWDGHRWTVVASSNYTSLSNWLESVSCPSMSFCQAVGFHAVNERGGRVLQQNLAERWNGHHWTVTLTPDRPTAFNDLYGISCASAASCVAVGRDEMLRRNVPTGHSEMELWNGRSWKLSTVPKTDVTGHSFSGVTCITAHRCTVVGTRRQGRVARTLVLALDAAGWAAVPSPNRTLGTDNVLSAVACPAAIVCKAVGFVVLGHVEQTLALSGP